MKSSRYVRALRMGVFACGLLVLTFAQLAGSTALASTGTVGNHNPRWDGQFSTTSKGYVSCNSGYGIVIDAPQMYSATLSNAASGQHVEWTAWLQKWNSQTATWNWIGPAPVWINTWNYGF